MRKTLLVTLEYPPKRGGVSHSLWHFHEHLPSDKVTVLTVPADARLHTPYLIQRQPLLATWPFVWPKWLPMVRHIRNTVRREKIELLAVGQILPIGTVALLLKKLYQLPYVVYVYGQDLVIKRRSFRKMYLIRKILSHADGVIAASDYTAGLATALGAPANRTITVYPIPKRFHPVSYQQDLDAFKKEHRLEGKKVLLSVGNLVTRKGHDMVLRALVEIKKTLPNVVYLVVGTGPREDYLRRLVHELGLESNVQFFARVPNVSLPLFYRSCDIFIMPSRLLKNEHGEVVDIEGFGMVYLEANAYAKPVIGGRSGGVPEAVAHNESGFLVNPEDPADIAAKALTLFNDPVLAATLGKQGKERLERTFVLSKDINRLEQLLS